MDFDEFAKRMIERTNRRKALLQETSVDTLPSTDVPPSTDKEILPPIHQSKTPPLRSDRRARLAELASRVGQWLEDEVKPHDPKPINNEFTPTIDMSINHGPQQSVQKLMNVNSIDKTAVTEIKSMEDKLIKKNESINEEHHQPIKPKINSSKLDQICHRPQSSIIKPLPNKDLANISTTNLTVAQRRALFEKNIAGNQKPDKKPVTTTTVTISLTKTTPKITNTTTNEVSNDSEDVKTPPRPIPSSESTPPSRRGSRPRASPAMVATSGDFVSQQRSTWTPPCIKNVLLKKKLIEELNDDQISHDNKTTSVPATSSPINTNIISPADRIAMSVGHVRIMPPSPSGGLYPDLSLIEDNDMSEINVPKDSLENQLTGCKRRSNGVNTLNVSTASSEFDAGDPEDLDNLNAKRPRCESKKVDANNMAEKQDSSDEESISASGVITTTSGIANHSESLLSSHAADSPLSQTCTSFTYHSHNDNFSRSFGPNTANGVANLQTNEPLNQRGLQLIDKYIPHLVEQENCHSDVNLSDNDKPSSSSSSNSCVQPSLVHTISTYRKQQQQLRLGCTSGKGRDTENKEGVRSVLLWKRLKELDEANSKNENSEDDNEEEDNEEEMEMAESRARHLEQVEVPQQDRIIEQATQALNFCYSSRNAIGQRPTVDSKFEYEYVHTERILLLAGLRRTDAVREAQRLHVERTLVPGSIGRKNVKNLENRGDGKTLVIESLRVPILMALTSGGNYKNKKCNTNERIENMTRWSGGYRYFVCAIRAAATVQRPTMTAVTQPVDVVEESVRRFSADIITRHGDDEIGHGYVDFITNKPVMVHGLDEEGWKITIELYGLSSTETGGLNYHNGRNIKENDYQENSKSVLDKLWSTVTTPIKESKKHHVTTTAANIESPSGSMAVRNTVFRQLGYFVFSDGQVNRQQFTLNKVHQSGSVPSSSRAATSSMEETVRIRMRLLEEGEKYICKDDEDGMNLGSKSSSSNNASVMTRKQLTLPSECKCTEGFLTLFDDHELKTSAMFERGRQWQQSAYNGGISSWRRLWFSVKIIDELEQSEANDNDINDTFKQKTIALQYWKYPEHAEQQQEPLGVINLGQCLPPSTIENTVATLGQLQNPIPAAPANSDLCARPNTLRLILYNDNYCNGMKPNVDDPVLLGADTADERQEWCDTVNAAVRAISDYREQIKISKANQLKINQKQKKIEEQQSRLQDPQRIGAWPITSNSKNSYKKKKFFE